MLSLATAGPSLTPIPMPLVASKTASASLPLTNSHAVLCDWQNWTRIWNLAAKEPRDVSFYVPASAAGAGDAAESCGSHAAQRSRAVSLCSVRHTVAGRFSLALLLASACRILLHPLIWHYSLATEYSFLIPFSLVCFHRMVQGWPSCLARWQQFW